MAPPLNFKTTTHDKTIHQTTYKGELIFVLHQVDNRTMACDNKDTTKEMYDIIGASLRLPKEDKDPFAYLGLQTSDSVHPGSTFIPNRRRVPLAYIIPQQIRTPTYFCTRVSGYLDSTDSMAVFAVLKRGPKINLSIRRT